MFVKLINENHFSKQSHRNPAAGFQGSLYFPSIPKEFEGSHPFFASGLAKMKTNKFLAQCLCLKFWEAQTSAVQY